MKELKTRRSCVIRNLILTSACVIALAACAPGEAGNNPGPFGNAGQPGDSNTAGGPTPQIQPGSVSQTAEAPGSEFTSTVVAPAAMITSTTAAISTNMSPTLQANPTDAIAAPTVQPAAVISAGSINYGVVELTISETIVPSVTAQILPVHLQTITATSSISETQPTPTLMTGTILLLGGFSNLNPEAATYQQPRIMVMPLESYIQDNAVVITPSLGNPFFDVLRLAITNNNQAIFSGSQLQPSVLFSQSPALSLKSGVTVAISADPQHLNFANGRGVRFVSALTEGQRAITAENLYYFYHGLSEDEHYYVAAILPIVNTPLALTSAIEAGATPDIGEGYDKYLHGVEEQLASENDEAFSKTLADYDALISSIRVRLSEQAQ